MSDIIVVKEKKYILDSRNFFVSLITIVFTIFSFNGETITVDPGHLVDAALSGNLTEILILIIPNFLNPVFKIITSIKEKTFNMAFLKSANFWTQIGTVVLVALSGFGIIFPEGAASKVIDAIFGGELGAIIVTVIVNLINPIFQILKDKITLKKNGN